MKSRLVAGALASVLCAGLGLASSASAEGPARIPTAVAIDNHTDLTNGGGTFTSVGGAVCPAGTTSDQATIIDKGYVWFFDVNKTFVCADGSGTFTMHIFASVLFCNASDAGSWEFTGGTGSYRRLRGEGHLIGNYVRSDHQPASSCDNDGIDDHFWGVLGRVRNR